MNPSEQSPEAAELVSKELASELVQILISNICMAIFKIFLCIGFVSGALIVGAMILTYSLPVFIIVGIFLGIYCVANVVMAAIFLVSLVWNLCCLCLVGIGYQDKVRDWCLDEGWSYFFLVASQKPTRELEIFAQIEDQDRRRHNIDRRRRRTTTTSQV